MDILRSFADAITRVLDRFYISSVRKDPESILYMKDPSLNVILALSELSLIHISEHTRH